jgi:integrase
VISAVFRYARQELVFAGVNPALLAKVPEAVRNGKPALTLEQLEKALAAMRYPEKHITIIALLTGMNVSEICGLRWKHLNLTGAWSRPDGELVPPISIAIKSRWYRGESANVKDNRKRTIQIPEVLLPMLLLLRARSNFTRSEDFVLTSRAGTAINISNITARRLGLIGSELGIQDLTLQTLRRAHGLISQGLEAPFQLRICATITSELQQLSAPRRGALQNSGGNSMDQPGIASHGI